MKLTKSRLKQLISEELTKLLNEIRQEPTATTVRGPPVIDPQTPSNVMALAGRARNAQLASRRGTHERADRLDPIQQQNLLNLVQATNKSGEIIDLETALTIVEELVLLHDYKIITKLGAGAFGIAFLLDNDHVFKVFSDGLEGVKAELENYENLQSKQFMGTAEINEPAIYDYGPIPQTKYYFAEIGKVIPLEAWFTMSGRDDKLGDLWDLVDFKNDLSELTQEFEVDDSPSDPRFKEDLLPLFSVYGRRFKKAGMTNEEIMAYFKAVLNLIREYGLGRTYDVHHQNVGVNIQNPSKFVIFDF